MTLGEIISEALQAAPPDPINELAQKSAAYELARQVAPLLRWSEQETFWELTYLPDEQLYLLETPQGWRELACFIAGAKGLGSPSYQPAIH